MISREDALEALSAERFDLVVIGGGITGAGVALDAASRGYSVALVERDDYASGTSSRSSKLVHGGLRYLQSFDLGLVREALLERALMVNLAPHLVHPLAFLVAGVDGKHPDRAVGAGLNMYDVMARERIRRRGDEDDWSPERHRLISAEQTLELAPALEGREPTGAYLFYDCQTDDVRLVLTVLGEAERFGTVMANRCEVRSLLDHHGRAAGVVCRDRLTDNDFEIQADNVVSATGVWADRIRPDELYADEEMPHIRPSRGTHVTVARETLPVDCAVIVPGPDGRSAFALPWLGRILLGTTDNDYEGSIEHVPPGAEDVEYLLTACNEFFGTSIGASDMTGAYAGVRPLVHTGDPKKSVDISRKAELFETSSGLLTITGGKLTTWRRMAKLTVDRVVEREGREAPCRTHEIPLGEPAGQDDLPEVEGVSDETRTMLAGRYGHAAREVLELAAARDGLANRIVPDLPDLVAEAPFAASHEQACTIGDVLLRRTRVGLLAAPELVGEDAAAPRAIAEAMAPELGWDEERIERELRDWRELAAAEGIAGP